MSARTGLIVAAASAAVIVATGVPAAAATATAPYTAHRSMVELRSDDTAASGETAHSPYAYLMALQLQLRRLTGQSGLHLATGSGGEGGQVVDR